MSAVWDTLILRWPCNIEEELLGRYWGRSSEEKFRLNVGISGEETRLEAWRVDVRMSS